MKTIILMDVSGVAYQTINRLTGYGGKNIPKIIKAGRKYLELESEQEEFLNQFHEELSKMSSIIAPLNVTDIFFVFDPLGEGSFRFGLYPEYKQTKTKKADKPFCKQKFKYCMQRYHASLGENGFNTLTQDRIEADDILYSCVQVIPEEYNICIATMDGDMKQLLDDRTFLYNNITGVITTTENFRMDGRKEVQSLQEFEDDEDDEDKAMLDIFEADFGVEDNYNKFFLNTTIVDAKMSLLEKILTGDTSDNIPSCFKYKTKNGASEFGFTDKRFKVLVEEHDIDLSMLEDDSKFQVLLETMSLVVGRPLDDSRLEEYKQSMSFNRDLIDLSKSIKHHSYVAKFNLETAGNMNFSSLKFSNVNQEY